MSVFASKICKKAWITFQLVITIMSCLCSRLTRFSKIFNFLLFRCYQKYLILFEENIIKKLQVVFWINKKFIKEFWVHTLLVSWHIPHTLHMLLQKLQRTFKKSLLTRHFLKILISTTSEIKLSSLGKRYLNTL